MQAAWSALVALWGLEGKLASIDTSIVGREGSGIIGDIQLPLPAASSQRCLLINTVAECIISFFFFVGLVRAVRGLARGACIVYNHPPSHYYTAKGRSARGWCGPRCRRRASCRCSTIARSAEAALPCPAQTARYGMVRREMVGEWWWCGRMMCEW
jgi:hypothetical protein